MCRRLMSYPPLQLGRGGSNAKRIRQVRLLHACIFRFLHDLSKLIVSILSGLSAASLDGGHCDIESLARGREKDLETRAPFRKFKNVFQEPAHRFAYRNFLI